MYEIFIYIWPPANLNDLNVSYGYWNYDPLITKKTTHRKLLVPKFPNVGERETRLANNPPPTSWFSSSALFSTMWLDHLAGKNGKMKAHHDSFRSPAKKIPTYPMEHTGRKYLFMERIIFHIGAFGISGVTSRVQNDTPRCFFRNGASHESDLGNVEEGKGANFEAAPYPCMFSNRLKPSIHQQRSRLPTIVWWFQQKGWEQKKVETCQSHWDHSPPNFSATHSKRSLKPHFWEH